MPPLFSTPKDLVRALHDRSGAARKRLREVLYLAIDQVVAQFIEQHGLPYDRDLLGRHAIHSVETYLRTRKQEEFEGMGWLTFRAVALVQVAKMVFPPTGSNQSGKTSEPDPLPECSAYQSQTLFLPYEKIGDCWVGGDWFGGARASDGSLWVIVADVTGHGYCAYLLASSLPAVWRVCWDDLPSDCCQPIALLQAMHNLLADCLPEGGPGSFPGNNSRAADGSG
jgi:hypothetical protein